MRSFLRPTAIKLIFLVEWTLFLAIQALRGELASAHQILVASYPLLFFYLVGCVLAALSHRTPRLASGAKLWGLAALLTATDQAVKAAVVAWIPYRQSAPIIQGWLHLAHARNAQGSWVLSAANVRAGPALLMAIVAIILLVSIPSHRNYLRRYRQSVWADTAFLGVTAGCASWICDMAYRRHIVDYIALPGVVTADLKDILLAIGVAALFTETVDNPALSPRGRV